MSRLIIHNQAVYNGLTKEHTNEKAVVLHEDYTDSELKAISKFFNDWFKDIYIYGSDAIEVVGGVVGEDKCLFCDPYKGQYFYLTMAEAEEHVHRNKDIYTGRLIPNIHDSKPSLIMEMKEDKK